MACNGVRTSVSQGLRVSVLFGLQSPANVPGYRFPKSKIYVAIDFAEKLYLAGFLVLQVSVTLLPILSRRSMSSACDGQACEQGSMEFLPLMLTSVYCAIGMSWGFCRLIFVFLHEETTYQGQLSEIR